MSNRTRAFFISLSILALLAFSAFGTVPVYADDGTTASSTETPTPTGTEQVDPTATEEQPTADGTTTDTSQGDTPVSTEQPAGDPSTTTEQPPADAATATTEAQPAAEATPLLEQVPDNTTVTVVDAAGEAQPLASQESAAAIVESDPIWCPSTVTTPTPGANGCTQSYSSFTELLDFLKTNEGDAAYQQDGTIFVQQGAYAGGEESIDFNSYNFTQLNQKNLTVTGGWDTNDGSVDSTSTFEVPIIIGSSSNPWVGSLTLNNIVIDGAADYTGLTLHSEGNIELNNVEVTNSQSGAEINAGGNVTVNQSDFHDNEEKGADITSGGNVDISDSDFSDNGSGDINNPTGSGLGINSTGAVTLLSVVAENNQRFGANITAGGEVKITQGFFDGNQGYYYSNGWQYEGFGLQVVTTNNITLDSVTADDNYMFGANLQGATISVTNASFQSNSSDWDENPLGYGLNIKSTDTITLEAVNANNNQMYGANIDAGNSVIISNSFFNGNQSYYWWGDKTYYGYGLQVMTGADITLDTVQANGNYVLGAHLEGSSVTIRDSSFSNNSSGSGLDLVGKGLEIIGITVEGQDDGDIALQNVVADNNQLFGANIVTTGEVAIGSNAGKTTSFSGHIDYVYDTNSGNILETTGGYGLRVVADGEIALSGVITTNNYLYGSYLEGANVNILDGTFDKNGSGNNNLPTGNGLTGEGYGIDIKSKGTVTLTNVSASNNQHHGANIIAVGNITVQTGFFSGHQAVTFTPCVGLTFYGYGLTAYSSTGDVSVDDVQANFNNLWGASLDGMSVFVSNSQFNNNVSDSSQFIDDTGLIVNSRGDFVLLNNVEAKENRLIGATVTAVGDVYVVNGSNFSDNAGVTCSLSWCPAGSQTYHGYGLNVVTTGNILAENITASGNNLFGANLQGTTVTVNGSTFANNQFGNGLTVDATGDVTLTNNTATNNGGNGAEVTTAACKVVQVNGGTYSDNDEYGLSVIGGVLTLDGTQIITNNGAGNIFENPSTCVVVLSAGVTATTQ